MRCSRRKSPLTTNANKNSIGDSVSRVQEFIVPSGTNVVTYRRLHPAAWLSLIFSNESIVTARERVTKDWKSNRPGWVSLCEPTRERERERGTFELIRFLIQKLANDGPETCTGCGFHSRRSFLGSLEIRVKLFRSRYLRVPFSLSLSLSLSLSHTRRRLSIFFPLTLSSSFFFPAPKYTHTHTHTHTHTLIHTRLEFTNSKGWKIDFHRSIRFCVSLTWFEDYLAEHDPARREIKLKLEETAGARVKLYGNVTCLLQHQVRYVREMDWLAVELVSTGAKINLRVGKDLRRNRVCVFVCVEITRSSRSKMKRSVDE